VSSLKAFTDMFERETMGSFREGGVWFE